jgi:hypothetical protein
MEDGGQTWWGPMAETTAERELFLSTRSFPRWATAEDVMDFIGMARPTIGCRGTPLVEDHRRGLRRLK